MSQKTKTLIAIIVVLIILLAIILLIIFKPGEKAQPPNDLYGVWTANGNFLKNNVASQLLLRIVTLEPSPDQVNTYLGTGCMQAEASEGWAPLTLQAFYNQETAGYTLNMLSTLISPTLDDGTAIIRLVGTVEMGGRGIGNDQLSGTAYVAAGEIPWSGKHTTNDIVLCPPSSDSALSFLGEFGVNRDLAYVPPFDVTNFHGETNIVSFQMRAEAPDGTILLADYETDIFSPQVNFIDQFRFDTHQAGTPLVDQPYYFALLDVVGVPLPGVEDVDAFRRCEQGAVTNLRAVVHLRPNSDQVDYVELLWDAPEIIPGYFDPENGNGFYQPTLEFTSWREGGNVYGAESIQASHNIPWSSFEPGAAGFPDGHDYGISLAELEDGQYIIFVGVYSYYDPPEGESGFDCRVADSRQALFLSKQGNQITVQPAGAISGFVTDANGNPLENVAVTVDGAGTGFHEGVCSGANGFYLFTRLPLDTFTLMAGGVAAEDCPANDFETHAFPLILLDEEHHILEGLDIRLNP